MQNDNGGSAGSAATWLGIIRGNNKKTKKPKAKPSPAARSGRDLILRPLTPRPAPRMAPSPFPFATTTPRATPRITPRVAPPKRVARPPVVSSSSPYTPKPVAPAPAPVKVAPKPTTTPAASSHAQATNLMQQFIDQARSSVNNQDLPALNELQRQLTRLNAEGQAEIEATGQRGQVVEQGTKQLYDQLVAFSTQAKDTNDAAYKDLSARTGTAYDQLLGSIGQNYDAARQATNSELARLGLSGQSPDATAGLSRDQAFVTNLAGVDKTNALSGMGNSQQGFDQLMSMMLSSQQHEGTSRQADAKANTNNQIAQLVRALNTGRQDIAGKQYDIRATQGQRIDELARTLEEKDYSRRADESDRDFSRRIAMADLGMRQQDQALQMAAANGGPSYSDQLDVALKQARLDQMLNPTAAGGKAPKLTPEQRAKQILHGALDNPGNKDAPRNMTDLWNIVQTLRMGTYDDNHNGINDIEEGRAKFDVNNPAMLSHLQYALQNRFHNTQLQSTALDIIRALTGKL